MSAGNGVICIPPVMPKSSVFPVILDDCGDTSDIEDWVEEGDGLNPTDETTLVKQGSHAMKLGVDADLSANDWAKWPNTNLSVDAEICKHDWLYLWIHFSTIDYIHSTGTALQVLIGDLIDKTAYEYFHFTKAQLATGWNLIKCDLDNYTGGSDVDLINWANINWMEIRINEAPGNVNDFYIVVDSIMFVRPK